MSADPIRTGARDVHEIGRRQGVTPHVLPAANFSFGTPVVNAGKRHHPTEPVGYLNDLRDRRAPRLGIEPGGERLDEGATSLHGGQRALRKFGIAARQVRHFGGGLGADRFISGGAAGQCERRT